MNTLTRRFAALCVALLVAAPGLAADEARPTVSIEAAQKADDRVRVTYQFDIPMDEEILEEIRSGVDVSFRHRVEVALPKKFWLSRRKVLAALLVDHSVLFDSLTGNYEVRREFRRKMKRKSDRVAPVVELLTTDDFDEMKSWLTRFEQIELYDPSVTLPSASMLARVEATMGREFVVWIFPRAISVTDEAPVEP